MHLLRERGFVRLVVQVLEHHLGLSAALAEAAAVVRAHLALQVRLVHLLGELLFNVRSYIL